MVGDFDSGQKPDFGGELIELPAEKDDTDSMFAVRQALARGFRNILLLGAAGGRADHSYANFQVLLHIARAGGKGRIESEAGSFYCFGPGRLVLEAQESWVSVFAAGGPARGVYLEGLRYPLADATLTPDYPLGASNEFAAQRATIRCGEGFLLVMVTPQ